MLIDQTFSVHTPLEAMSPIAVEPDFTRRYIEKSNNEFLVRRIQNSFDRAAWEKDFVIIEGTGPRRRRLGLRSLQCARGAAAREQGDARHRRRHRQADRRGGAEQGALRQGRRRGGRRDPEQDHAGEVRLRPRFCAARPGAARHRSARLHSARSRCSPMPRSGRFARRSKAHFLNAQASVAPAGEKGHHRRDELRRTSWSSSSPARSSSPRAIART